MSTRSMYKAKIKSVAHKLTSAYAAAQDGKVGSLPFVPSVGGGGKVVCLLGLGHGTPLLIAGTIAPHVVRLGGYDQYYAPRYKAQQHGVAGTIQGLVRIAVDLSSRARKALR